MNALESIEEEDLHIVMTYISWKTAHTEYEKQNYELRQREAKLKNN
jgi:hypothetical protein